MFNPLITATAGWSEAVEERAKRLLDFHLGVQANGASVTVATMLARCQFDPVASARFLMIVPPLTAQRELAETMARFQIDGCACPDPAAMARSALSYAGRAVAVHEIHPERLWLANLLGALLGSRRQSH